MAEPVEDPDVDLGWRSQAILAAIHEHGGTANTSQIRDATGIQGGTRVPYRMKNKLPSAELIEIERPGLDDRGRNLPMEATLTETGERLAQRIVEAEDEDRLANMSDHTEQLEAKVNQLQTRVEEAEDALESRREADADVADALESLENQIEDINERVTRLENGERQ